MRLPDTALNFIVHALPELRTWPGRPVPDDLAPLPGCPALYLLVDAQAAPVQLATTQALKRLLTARLAPPQPGHPAKADLGEITRGVRWRPLATPFEGRWWYYRVARVLYPQEYRRLISFGPAYFLHADWDQTVPEIHVTERIWCLPGEFIGPWPTHKACQEALEGLWDLFDLCRYPEQVRKAPQGTRCAYADMGRCDAPCDGAVPLAAYAQRCRSAWRFAQGGITAWRASAEQRMQAAAAARAYESAGLIKRQIRFAQTWQAQWAPRVRPAEQMHYLLGLPVTRRRAWKLFLFRAGDLVDGPVVRERCLVAEALAWLQAPPSPTPPDRPPVVSMEQTWLFAHWLFGRSVDSAVLVSLPPVGVPADLQVTLTDQLTVVHERRATNAGSAARDTYEPDAADTASGPPPQNSAGSFDSPPNAVDTQ